MLVCLTIWFRCFHYFLISVETFHIFLATHLFLEVDFWVNTEKILLSFLEFCTFCIQNV